VVRISTLKLLVRGEKSNYFNTAIIVEKTLKNSPSIKTGFIEVVCGFGSLTANISRKPSANKFRP
jgi:hypothetical protein